ncbi:hypothetical protein ACIO3S_24590 [Nocardioides sp. NPDC087217]|uniref:hypothetical protein n=1 Tax=Nocardioides sp. NPDC087217 TaxID=3364335 RepID=UPI0037F6B753
MNDPTHPDNTDPAAEPGDAGTDENGQRRRASARYEAELTKRQAMRGGWSMTKRWIAIKLTDTACVLLTGLAGTGVLGGAAAVAWRTWAGG